MNPDGLTSSQKEHFHVLKWLGDRGGWEDMDEIITLTTIPYGKWDGAKQRRNSKHKKNVSGMTVKNVRSVTVKPALANKQRHGGT